MSRNFPYEAAELYPVVSTAGRDYKAWAKRILWRQEQKDPELTTLQIKFAEEAMNRGANETTPRASA